MAYNHHGYVPYHYYQPSAYYYQTPYAISGALPVFEPGQSGYTQYQYQTPSYHVSRCRCYLGARQKLEPGQSGCSTAFGCKSTLRVHKRHIRIDSFCPDEIRPPALQPPQHRRGRGERKNAAYWRSYSSKENPFNNRECLFESKCGRLSSSAQANIDTGCNVPGGLIMSLEYATENGWLSQISSDFSDPLLESVSGHATPIYGIVRDVRFRLRGSSETFIRDFFVCDVLDGLVDIMVGADFIKEQFELLFGRVKHFYKTASQRCLNTFATWFSRKKETPQEKEERRLRETEQQIKALQLELARLQKQQEAQAARSRSRNVDPNP